MDPSATVAAGAKTEEEAPVWATALFDQLEVIQFEVDAIKVQLEKLQEHLDTRLEVVEYNTVARFQNSMAKDPDDPIYELKNAKGVLPSDIGLWFPRTLRELQTAGDAPEGSGPPEGNDPPSTSDR